MDVLVIGAAGLDVKGQVGGPLQMGTSNPGVIRQSPGGVARNIAENLARLGVEVTLITALGDDWPGRYILENARQVGINTDHILVRPDFRTGIYLALQDQEKQLIVGLDDMGAIQAVTPRYLHDRRRLFQEAEMIVIDANLSPAALEMVFRLAARYDRPVCADPTSAPLAVRLQPFLGQLHLVTPNLQEAYALLGEVGEAAAAPSVSPGGWWQRGSNWPSSRWRRRGSATPRCRRAATCPPSPSPSWTARAWATR